MSFDARITELGFELPPEPTMPPHVRIAFDWARVVDNRCVLSGHGALGPDGAPIEPYGKVPVEVDLEAAQGSAHLAALAMLASLRRAVGTLDRVHAWVAVNGFVNAEPGYTQTTAVLNPVSDLLVEVFGAAGRHARTAIGVAALPMDLPVVISAEVILKP